jgi:hypothetical protein
MITISSEDTQWAIAGHVATTVLEQLAAQLPAELQQGDGAKIVAGEDGFAALLVFGDLPNATLAKELLLSTSPVYLLDFDDDAPATVKLDRKQARVTETHVDTHPADFLEEHGIEAPGFAFTPSTVRSVSVVEGVPMADARRAMTPIAEVELFEHPRGLLVIHASFGGMLATKFAQRAYLVYCDPEDKEGWFCCVVYELGRRRGSFSPFKPDPGTPPLDHILGETTLEGIMRVLEIPAEHLGLPPSGASGMNVPAE